MTKITISDEAVRAFGVGYSGHFADHKQGASHAGLSVLDDTCFIRAGLVAAVPHLVAPVVEHVRGKLRELEGARCRQVGSMVEAERGGERAVLAQALRAYTDRIEVNGRRSTQGPLPEQFLAGLRHAVELLANGGGDWTRQGERG